MHINAQMGEIAEIVFLPGDPLRAKWIAETFFKPGFKQYNTVRNMLGFTGVLSNGKKVSVQGSGMGMPSLGIYVHELIIDYGVKNIIRVGSAGSMQPFMKCNDVVVASGACTDSAMNKRRFHDMEFAPVASWELLKKVNIVSKLFPINLHVGNILSVDKFYEDVEPYTWKIFAEYGVLAIEMETAELYTLAAKYNINALSILTISDNLLDDKEKLSADERERAFKPMMELAIELVY